jgi:O-antigen ligase
MNWTKILKLLIFVGVVVLLYVPFIVSNGMFFPYITGKAYTFRIITEIIFGLYLILAICDPDYRPKKNWILYMFGAFTLSTFISNILGTNPLASFWSNYERMEGWVTIVHLLALFIALSNTFIKKTDWSYIFNTSVLFSIFMSFAGLAEVLEKGWNFRIDTNLGNSTYVGIYALINAFLALYLLVNHLAKDKFDLKTFKIKIRKIAYDPLVWIYVLAFILNSVITFQTGTRGSMLGWIGGLLLSGVLMIFLSKEKPAVKISAGVLIAVVVIFVASIFALKDTSLIQNNISLKRITSISITEGTAKARLLNWQMAIEGFKERPILGWGQSNFNYVFDKHYLPEHHGNEVWFDRAHNIIFDWLIAGGILGLLLYLTIWVALVLKIFRTERLIASEKSILIGLLAGYFVHNLFVFDQIISYIYFALILSMAASFSDKNLLPYTKEISKKAQSISSAIIAVLMIVVIYTINGPSYAANLELIEAMKITQQREDGSTGYYHEDGLRGNIEMYRQAIGRDTFGTPEIRTRALLAFNQINRIQGISDQDKALFIEMIITEMDKEIARDQLNSRYPYMLGVFFMNLNQFEVAEEYMLKARELSPTKQELMIPLIRMYNATDQSEKAISLAKEVYELDTTKDDLWLEYVKVLARHDIEKYNEMVDASLEEAKEKVSSGDSTRTRLEKLLQSNVESNPDRYQNMLSLAAYYTEVGQRENAISVLNQTSEKFPEINSQIQALISEIEAGNNPVGEEF